MNLHRTLSIFGFMFLSTTTFAATTTVPLWAGLDDIIKYSTPAVRDAKPIQIATTDSRFTVGGMKFVYSLTFSGQPTSAFSGAINYPAVAMMSDAQGTLYYRKFNIAVGGTAKNRVVQDIEVVQDIPLSAMHFRIDVGLLERMAVVEDAVNEVSLLFPLGVGGLDENLTGHGRRILTPRYQNAWIDRTKVIAKLGKPDYYRHEPYMAIINSKGTPTPVAFHITILNDDGWQRLGPNFLARGFESHACMRMRQKDLHQLFAIVKGSADVKIPVNVDFHLNKLDMMTGARIATQGIETEEAQYPREDDSYMRLKNFAPPGQPPITQRDPDEHLMVMERVNAAPDLRKLSDFDASETMDLKEFEGLSNIFSELQ